MLWSWQLDIILIPYGLSRTTYKIQIFQSKNVLVTWAFRNWWFNNLHFLKTIRIQVTHIFCEGTRVTDLLSKEAIHTSSSLLFLHFQLIVFFTHGDDLLGVGLFSFMLRLVISFFRFFGLWLFFFG